MSKWVEGKLDIKCSIDVLRRALVNIMPEWEDHIRVDPSGRIPLYRYDGQRSDAEYADGMGELNVNILIPGGGNPNYASPPGRKYNNDWGFINTDEGWKCVAGDYGRQQSGVGVVENRLKGEIARMKAIAVAKLRGYQVIRDESTDEETITDIECDEDTVRQLVRA